MFKAITDWTINIRSSPKIYG